MDCDRKMIYLAFYESGIKKKRAGYVIIFTRGESCEIQIFYNGKEIETENALCPVYVFKDGTSVRGEEIILSEGMAATNIKTGRRDFLQSGKSPDRLEAFYLEGVKNGVCGGRPDGQDPCWGMDVTAPESLCLEYTEEARKQNQPVPNLLMRGSLRRCRRPNCRNL